ncbi:MAG: hypothetical protein ACOCV9_07205, partial [Marinilabiliaceae bacterium]
RLVDEARINTITVAMMEVPCCGGLLRMVRQAVAQSGRNVPVKMMIISVEGEVLKEEWTEKLTVTPTPAAPLTPPRGEPSYPQNL